ncbi:TIGR03943 family putative permease subunit [Amycolatopsis thermoflava]|uniref:TIGR03943 family putative permease subunit n=1 Tax=Amycolatopsis thermoflava TaxID=84480 RepID=UPI003D7029CA
MTRETQNVLLLLVGGALIKITLDGSYLRYVKPVMAPWLLAAGTVIVALAAIAIARDIRAARNQPVPPPGLPCDEPGHEHHSRSPWLLLVPVLVVFLIAPPALGSDAANRAGTRTIAAPSGHSTHRAPFPPLPPSEVTPLRFVDLVTRAGWDSAGTLDNRTLQISGFITHGKTGAPFLARIVINCCAADAYPIHARLTGADLSHYPNDQWLTITGTVEPYSATEANRYTPTIHVTTAHPVPAPADPYEF